MVTLGDNKIIQQSEIDPNISICINQNITNWIQTETWEKITVLTQEYGDAVLEYQACLIGCHQVQLVRSRWQLEGDAMRGSVLKTEKINLLKQAHSDVTVITYSIDNRTDTTVDVGQNNSSVSPENLSLMAPKFDVSTQDYQILRWLHKAQDFENLSVNWRKDSISVQCHDRYQALYLSDAVDMLTSTEMKWVKIYVGRQCITSVSLDRLRGSTTYPSKSMLTATIETMPSIWAKQNLRVFEAIPGTVSLLSAEPGHRYLAVKPEISEGRLNKPIATLINQPIQTLDEELWVPRQRAIEEVIQTGENVTYYYEHLWRDLVWRFQCTVAKASDSEVMTIVEDLDDPIASWQKVWWRNQPTVTA